MDERLSIEESFALLREDSSPTRSPLKSRKTARGRRSVRKSSREVPDDDIFELLKSDNSSETVEKSESEEEKSESESEEEEAEEEEEKSESEEEEKSESESEEEEEEAEEKSESDSEEEEAEEEEEKSESEEEKSESEEEDTSMSPESSPKRVELSSKSKRILPITPKRFTVSSPRTPTEKLEKRKKRKNDGSFLQKLKEFRYNILRVIYVDNNLSYVVCYDPYGQLVFVSCPEEAENEIRKRDNVEKFDTVRIVSVPEKIDNPLDEAFVNAIKEKVNMSVFGLVFYNGVDYQICERNRKGFFKDKYCALKGEYKDEKLSLPQTFIITQYHDIFEDHLVVIENNKENYENIQHQQLSNSNHTFKEIVRSMESVKNNLITFKDYYQSHSKGIMSDWNIMGKKSKEYYQKYSDQKLDEEENEEYDLVSLNMFLRFQFFNQNIELMDKLNIIRQHMDQASSVLCDAIDEIGEKEENVKHKIVKKDEIDRYI